MTCEPRPDREIFQIATRLNGMTIGWRITGARALVQFLRDDVTPAQELLSVRAYRTDDDWDRIRKHLGYPQSWEVRDAHVDTAA